MGSYDQDYNECCDTWTDPLGECKCKGEKQVAKEERMRHAQWLAAEKIRQEERSE